jgi:hypothetical protein
MPQKMVVKYRIARALAVGSAMWGIFMRLILGGIQLILNKLTLQIMINK